MPCATGPEQMDFTETMTWRQLIEIRQRQDWESDMKPTRCCGCKKTKTSNAIVGSYRVCWDCVATVLREMKKVKR